jgi:hypothetical protein
VIAAERCAELFGLRVLERRIQDLKLNFTTSWRPAGPEARLVSAKTRQQDSSRRSRIL